MKKSRVIVISLVILLSVIAIVLFWRHRHTMTGAHVSTNNVTVRAVDSTNEVADTRLYQQVAGNWTLGKAGKMTITADGRYSVKGRRVYRGTWQISGGIFIMTHTNAPPLGVERYKINHVDDHQLILELITGNENEKPITLNR